MAMVAEISMFAGADNPVIEEAGVRHTRVSWRGSVWPRMIGGLSVNFCSDGMMCLGPIDTPVRYRLIDSQSGLRVMELQIPLAGLRMLTLPCSRPAARNCA